MIAVHKEYRGQNYLPILYYWVRSFIQDNFNVECFNTDAPLGHTMIKATQLTNTVVDTFENRDITDKEFFYDYAGFSVRVQKGVPALLFATLRPVDEEAVLYIPLLPKQEQQQNGERTYLGPNNIHWEVNIGARVCDNCGKIPPPQSGSKRCQRCLKVHYCDRTCQKADWKRHKQWCGKTKQEFHQLLVQKGLRN